MSLGKVQQHMNRRSTVFTLLFGLMVGVGLPMTVQATIITFDEFPADNGGTLFPTRYSYLGVTFISPDDGGTQGGVSNGDPGNWDLDGTNGPIFSGFNGSSYSMTMLFSGDVSGFSLDASRANGSSPDTTLTLTGWENGSLIESTTIGFGAINNWATVSLSNIVDEVRWQSIGPSPNKPFEVSQVKPPQGKSLQP